MDHSLEDTLNLENAMGVDFGTTDAVEVNEAELILPDGNHNESVPMEFEQIEEQPMLMDTGNEEIIDFMGDQFTLQEYSVQDDQTTGLTTTAESNQNVLSEQAEAMVDLQLQTQPTASVALEMPKLVAVKAPNASRLTSARKNVSTAQTVVPRQVAIAPKPSKVTAKPYAPGKQFAIAPKPVTLVARNTMLKKVSLANVPGSAKGNTVLAQIGKQLVMVPAGAQKLKLVSAANPVSSLQYVKADPDQPQLIAPNEQPKPVMMTKVIVQGNPNLDLNNQPVVITKLMPTTSTKSPQTRVVSMQQKTLPIAIGNKVVMASPTKQGVKLGKKQQIITIRSPTPKLLPAPPSGPNAKKVILSTNPPQNVILKTTAPPKNAQVSKDGSVVVEAQQTQLHQINVPGKGIQYIRLVTNSTPATSKGKGGSVITVPSKFVLTDGKGGKPQKLLRIAPVMSKPQVTAQPARSSQSLLAPLSPLSPALRDVGEMLESRARALQAEGAGAGPGTGGGAGAGQGAEADSKAALRSLIQSTLDDAGDMQLSVSEVEVEYNKPFQSPKQERSRSMEQIEPADQGEGHHSLIVIPSAFNMTDNVLSEEISKSEESQRSLISIEAEGMNSFQSPDTPPAASEPEVGPTELGLRPRKACNCTKSQCLKLYCDCFANGEFCNRCNCNNCHNNLENEELRQKAIRGCLERNPNAFRPKIGKAKIGGPEIIRRHNKGCNCKRSGCLKNYCECYEAKIACTSMCKCVGCRNVEESLERARRSPRPAREPAPPHALRPARAYRPPPPAAIHKQPCSFMTNEVIEAVCQCLLAAAVERGEGDEGAEGAEGAAPAAGEGAQPGPGAEPLRDVLEEFARCLQDIISAAHQAPPLALLDDVRL